MRAHMHYVHSKKHFEMCLRCACVSPFFEHAMRDCTLVPFCTFLEKWPEITILL